MSCPPRRPETRRPPPHRIRARAVRSSRPSGRRSWASTSGSAAPRRPTACSLASPATRATPSPSTRSKTRSPPSTAPSSTGARSTGTSGSAASRAPMARCWAFPCTPTRFSRFAPMLLGTQAAASPPPPRRPACWRRASRATSSSGTAAASARTAACMECRAALLACSRSTRATRCLSSTCPNRAYRSTSRRRRRPSGTAASTPRAWRRCTACHSPRPASSASISARTPRGSSDPSSSKTATRPSGTAASSPQTAARRT
mmetsp:Transcript_5223/g.21501  ORF Transcript_5223/g.21501 Transcript_5223/m.21501 type:complete len:259 (-) Transcript_5223:1579-2355(-)